MRLKIFLILVAAVSLSVLALADVPESPHDNDKLDCESCHSQVSFKEIDYDHSQTGFSIDGAHGRLECIKCHSLKDFSTVEGDCVSCHADIHEAKLGSDCQRCHGSVSWSVFDVQNIHMETEFPIVGRHALLDCMECHQSLPRGDISFNTTRCVDCHQSDYLNVMNPNHVVAGLSTDCQACHQMDIWRPALLPEHDLFFPIRSGKHAGEWDDCTTCHTSPSSFQEFSCFACHEHDQTPMDETHNGIAGYTYNSSDCYLCHPTGEKGTFASHDAQYFPIFTGVHGGEWSDCRTCHDVPTNRQIFNCLSCHEHTQEATAGQHGSMPGYAYNSQDCYFCHPTGQSGEYVAHDADFFPIFSGAHKDKWAECTTCHTDQTTRAVIYCFNCHDHDQDVMDEKHQGRDGYVYDSYLCYGCHENGKS